uniref:Uncharacterized protein n=1 Tax=Arundo donax TaxID=35708 RepID=A0A0A9GEJ3_ARUDO
MGWNWKFWYNRRREVRWGFLPKMLLYQLNDSLCIWEVSHSKDSHIA